MTNEDFKWKLGRIFYDLAEGKIGVLEAYERYDAIKAVLPQANVSGNEVALPSDDEMRAFAKEWASSFEGKERLGMESAHYSGQAYMRNKMIILGVPNGT